MNMLALKHCGFLSDHTVKTPRFFLAEFGRTKMEELNHFGQCFKIVYDSTFNECFNKGVP